MSRANGKEALKEEVPETMPMQSGIMSDHEEGCTASTILAGCVNRFCRFDSFSDC